MKQQTAGARRASALALQERVKPSWIELVYVDEREDARTSWVVVTLNCNGHVVSGTSPALKKRKGRLGIHRAALATIRAIEIFSGHELSCDLVDVACVTSRSHPAILVRVRVASDEESAELFGIARVEDDFAAAGALAVLDAANVYVHSLLDKE